MARRAATAGDSGFKRRRRQSGTARERTSLSLRADVVAAAKRVVEAGEAENLSAFVEEALEEKLLRTKRAALYAAYDEARNDAVFVADMNAVAASFARTEGDGLD